MWASAKTSAQYDAMGIICFISFMDETSPGYASLAEVYRRITKNLLDQIPATDVRKGTFDGTRTQTKFKASMPNSFEFDDCYMRVSEMYLNAAEAAARMDDLDKAKGYLNQLILKRDSAPPALPTTKDELIKKILLERRIELWGEGFAFRDIKRLQLPLQRPTGAGNHLAGNVRVTTLPAGDPKFNWKIPRYELDANPNLSSVDQN